MKRLRLPANMAFIGIVGMKLGGFNAMLAFIVSGAIPGTLVNIPSGFMLLISITGLWLLLLRLSLPILVSRHALQVETPIKAAETVVVDTIVYTSGQPGFRLFSPVVHVGR